MRETRADTAQALLLALLLHALLFGLVLFGLWWTRAPEPVSAAGSPVQADIVDADALSASMQRALRAPTETKPAAPTPDEATPPPQPLPEPKPQQATEPRQTQAQEPVPVPDQVDQERVDRDALAAQAREREQEAKRRQQQIDLTERQRQADAENMQRLMAQKEAERRKQLADIRKQQAAVAKEIDLRQQKLQQLADAKARNAAEAAARADAAASAPAGNNGPDNDLKARYVAAIQAAILQNWTRPDSVPLGQRCRIIIHQLPGGTVAPDHGVEITASCPYDDAAKRLVEAAVLKAQPLPYAGFEAVFDRTLNLNFEAQDR